ncbi:hypothetical protein [Glaciihabitans tibetensis]|nr:hypothetical protein [Glaciihabitans tibetensis]
MFTFSRGCAALATVLLLSLTGCAPADTASAGDLTTTPRATTSATPTKSATTTPTAPATPAVPAVSAPPADSVPPIESLIVSADGLGPITLGSSWEPENADTAIARWNPTYCLDRGLAEDKGAPEGGWEANYQDVATPAGSSLRKPFVLSGTAPDSITSVLVYSADITTPEGIHVGSSREEVLAAYPTFDQVTPGTMADVYVINGTHGRLVIEVAAAITDAGPGDWAPGVENTVLWMRVAPLNDQPVGSLAGSDSGGNCWV